jgi:hypothetical protein
MLVAATAILNDPDVGEAEVSQAGHVAPVLVAARLVRAPPLPRPIIAVA